MIQPSELIDALRESDLYLVDIFTRGSCYRFHLFLKAVYPEAEPFIDEGMNHVISKIGDKFYDIRGVFENSQKFRPLTENDLEVVEEWSFRGHMLLQIGECPVCEEPIIYEQ